MASSAEPSFEIDLEPTASALPEARHQFESWLTGIGVRAVVIGDLVTAASELCTNAIRAADTKVTLRSRVDGGTLIFEVSDDGPGFGPGAMPDEEPDPLAIAGRGLYVAKQLVDVLWVAPDPKTGGTIARCGRRLN
jgi:anti-sigma regulatory factor (Ser/Thr protein kinase)